MASIEKARSARGGYVVRYRGPDRKARTKTFRRRIDATTFLRTIDTDVIRGDYIDPNAGRVTLREFGARWWASSVNLRPSTVARNDATYRNQVLPTFGDLPLSAIDHLSVQEWVARLSASGLASATVQRAHQVLAKILRAAVRGQLLKSSPCDDVDLPRIENEEMLFLGSPDVARLAAAIDHRYRALVLLGAYGGLRAGEMFGRAAAGSTCSRARSTSPRSRSR
ncbi:MAG: N-terminal phage integrase SAM-like domain-containing protein [Actinomycetota bacterium]|nr:N-terminal phage integrase SAM-like domain-containing protein [Actinomycetota bacterium]